MFGGEGDEIVQTLVAPGGVMQLPVPVFDDLWQLKNDSWTQLAHGPTARNPRRNGLG